MRRDELEIRSVGSVLQAGPLAAAFGVLALVLFAMGFPLFILFFFGVLGYFVWKVFTSDHRGEARDVFEFYLVANDILRDDDRRWYGFEIREAIERGERVSRAMRTAPPLVHYALGSLYEKAGDNAEALKHFTQIDANGGDVEAAIVHPSRELRAYVSMLRRIERSSAEAPLTASAIRSLERRRRNNLAAIIEECRTRTANSELSTDSFDEDRLAGDRLFEDKVPEESDLVASLDVRHQESARKDVNGTGVERLSISEVLHDIYDSKPQ